MLDTVSFQDRISRLISSNGPITIAEYMGSANAHYYGTRDPLGADGDFTTAPEISQMFGELVGLALADVGQRAGGHSAAYVELGPGRGTLARDALGAMAQAGVVPSVHLVETSPTLRARQAALLASAIHHDDIADLPTDRPLLIVANEFFDALPVRQFIKTEQGWRERMVALTGQTLTPTAGHTPMDAEICEGLMNAAVGSIAEQCSAGQAIVRALAERLERQGGAMLIIDYGYSGPATGDTLQAVRGHRFADPFGEVGESDLTAHVDFAALALSARHEGAAVAPLITQGEWLVRLGIDARTAILAARNPDRATDLHGQRDRLAKADAMGHLFRVLAIHSSKWPRPAGFDS